jgi:hypothetical protein
MFLDKATGIFTQNISLYFSNRLKFFYSCMCVCDQFPEQYPSANLENCPNLPKPRVGAMPLGFGTRHPATLQPTKTIKKTHFITRKTMIN